MVEYNEKYEYIKIEQTEEFKELKRRKYRFIFPVPLLFIVYYLLFIVMSAYAQDFISQSLWGNLTMVYLFGVFFYLLFSILYFYLCLCTIFYVTTALGKFNNGLFIWCILLSSSLGACFCIRYQSASI